MPSKTKAKTKPEEQTVETTTEEEPTSVIRSVRFRKDQFDKITLFAQQIGLDFSTFIRMSALKCAGVSRDEIQRQRQVIKALESVGK